jgi:hypothetical protein
LPLLPGYSIELNKRHYKIKDKQIKNVGADSGHFFMAVPDMVVMFYGYIFPCLDSKRGNEAGDSVRRGDSSSGTLSLSLSTEM